MLKILICDDSKAVIDNVRTYISRLFPNRFEIFEATSYDRIDPAQQYDILLMDIDLKDDKHNGISIAGELNKNNENLQVIFISMYHEYAQDIFELKPVYYVQKPIDEMILKVAIERALENIGSGDNTCFHIQQANKFIAIPVKNILYFESKLRRVKIVTDTKEYEYYSRLDDVQKEIANLCSYFIRSHQSYLVNARHIKSMDKSKIYLNNGQIIPVSKARYQTARMEYAKFITRE